MIESKSLDKLNRDLNKIGKELVKKVIKIPDSITMRLGEGAIKIRNTILRGSRETPKTGKIYRRGKGGRQHIASSPGNYPALDFGEFMRSITFDVRPMEIEVGSEGGAPYAPVLEFGTDRAGRNKNVTIDARPWLDPSVEKEQKEIIDDIGKEVFEIIKNAVKVK